MASTHHRIEGTGQISIGLEFKHSLPIPKAFIYKAIEMVYFRYLVLRCTINYLDGSYYINENALLKNIDVQFHINECTNFEGFVKECLNSKKILTEKSLWKIDWATTSLSSSCFVISIHHSVIDSVGVNQVINYFLTCLDLQQNNEKITMMNASSNLPRSIDEFLPEGGLCDIVNSEDLGLAFHRNSPVKGRSTDFHLKCLGLDLSEKLSLLCINKSVTKNSLLTCLFSKVVNENWPEIDMSILKSAVSLRELSVNTCIDDLGCFIDVVSVGVSHTDDVYEDAKAYERKLIKNIYKSCLVSKKYDESLMLKAASYEDFKERFDPGITFTNIGDINIRSGLEYIFPRKILPLAKRVSSTHACVLHVYEFNNEINLCLVFSSPIFSKENARKLMVNMEKTIESIFI